jgi:hypothetical protein
MDQTNINLNGMGRDLGGDNRALAAVRLLLDAQTGHDLVSSLVA